MAIQDDHLDTQIAVIGMSARMPGAADLTTFWTNLRNGAEAIITLSDEELLAAGEDPDKLRDPSYVRAAAPLEDIDQFDAAFFGMSPRDAAVFDPQHRLFLECAWEAFEHAGYVGERIDGAVGVFASCGMSEYMFKNVMANERIAASVGEWLVRHTGNDTNFLATRVSYEMDLHGPSLNVQTACSSTLVAVHLACQSILSGECDLALVGGAVVAPVQRRGYVYKEGEILSPDGRCRAFDASSAGTLTSSACGAALLKPLRQALADDDNVLAVIRGSAINNDGRAKVGYLAPSVAGQAEVVMEALAVAGVDARDVTYVETHGTGTLIGDPIEIAGLTRAYRVSTDDTGFCAVGSLKTNIGHTGEAAGIAALIKTVLALQHREIPASLHFHEPNPQADFPNSPFFVNAELRPWEPGPGGTRVAGITGLGAGGTNAHVIIEEAPATRAATRASAPRPRLLTVSARTADSLRRASVDLAEHLRADPDLDLGDVAYTRLVGRKGFAVRRAVVAATVEEAAAALDAPARAGAGFRPGEAPSVVFMMPGGGAQYPGMGRELYESEPVYRAVIDDCAAALRRVGGVNLLGALFPSVDVESAARRLEAPSLALPALYATEVAMGRLLGSWGVNPQALIGHSAGEYAAACLAGVVSLEDGLALVARRGVLFETLPKGAMLSVALAEDDLRDLLPAGVDIAAVNAPALCVASGPVALIDDLAATLAARDVDAARIHIDVAAHSSMLEPILAEFAAFCRTIAFHEPQLPYVSNLTGTWVTAAEVTDPDYWVRHLRAAVRFGDGVATLLDEPGRVLLEIGPGRTLAGLARQSPGKPAAVAPTLRHPQEEASDVAFALAAVGRAWETGVDLDAAALFADAPRRRVPLPTYPFERQRYWVEPDPAASRGSASNGVLRKRQNVDEWFATPSWRRAVAAADTNIDAHGPVVVIDDGDPLAAALAARLAATRRVLRVSFGVRFDRRSSDHYTVQPSRPDDWTELVDALVGAGALPGTIVHMTALGPSRGRRRLGLVADDEIAAYEATVERDHAGLVFLARALSARSEAVRLALVTSGVHGLDSTDPLHPERALLHGAGRVVPRELGHVATMAIDVDAAPTGATATALVAALERELDAEWSTDVVALRRGERWIRTFEPVTLPPMLSAPWPARGVHLLTGGFGGIALSIAEQIAKSSAAPTLVLVGRTTLPPESAWETATTNGVTRRRIEAVQHLRTLGATVVVAAADVTDEMAMAALVERVRADHGPISTVIHSAGVLHDALIALRTPFADSVVVDVKAKGALVLGKVLAKHPPELFVLFSSVSSIIGLPGQIDYTAANAFLDAYGARVNRGPGQRAVVVNWNTWQEVGMAVEAARVERDQAPTAGESNAVTTHLFDAVDSEDEAATYSTGFSRRRHWLLDEHVVRGGEALIPGTGFLELLRGAVTDAHPGRAVELSDVFFLSPFVVADGEVRTLRVKHDRATGVATVFSDTETAPHVTATATLVDDEPDPLLDVAAVRARCTTRAERFDGYSNQPFLEFGPRWGSLRAIDFGDGEALVEMIFPKRYVDELADLWLHPALMDIATGSAQELIPDFDQATMFFVPFSYGRVRSRRPLPAHALAHVRLRNASGTDIAVFDIAIVDEHGVESVLVESFTMRRVAAGAALTSLRRQDAPLSEPAGLESTVGAAMREGILPSEGVDAFDRIVASGLAVQVVASSVDVGRWLDKVDAEARAGGEGEEAFVQYERPNITSDFVAPATTIERELATMWRELLGVERVGRDDDFFELGGQSLIAVRLFTRMKKRYSIDLPLSTLFEAPTIAQCAGIVAGKLGIVEELDDADAPDAAAAASTLVPLPVSVVGTGIRPLVTIQRGNASLLPFFCVHGSGGNVLNFRDMSQAMGRSQPFYGLQAIGLDGLTRPPDTIEEMAASYIAEVKTVQPEGPYVLGGYSGGGLIAFEMAHQLQAEGADVALVCMLDTMPPVVPLLEQTTRERLTRLREAGLAYPRQIVMRRVDAWKRKRARARIDKHIASGQVIPGDLRTVFVEEAFMVAAAHYVRKPYRGHVVLFRAEIVLAAFRPLGDAYGWDELVDGNFELIKVPGDHDTLLLEPNATTLVQDLRAMLDSIQRPRRAERAASRWCLGHRQS